MAISESAVSVLPSRGAILTVAGVSLAVVHTWALYHLFAAVPGFVVRMSLLEVVSVAAYVLLGALLDSVLVAAGAVVVGLVLARLFGAEHFVAFGTAAVLLLLAVLIPIHYAEDTIRDAGVLGVGAWALAGAAALAAVVVGVRRSERVPALLREGGERLLVLGALYALVDMVSLVTVVLRNVTA